MSGLCRHEALDAPVVVARDDVDERMLRDLAQEVGHFVLFLEGGPGHVVLDVAQQYNTVRLDLFDVRHDAIDALRQLGRDVDPAVVQVMLDAQVHVGQDQRDVLAPGDQCGRVDQRHQFSHKS